jgi:hypothetical protein
MRDKRFVVSYDLEVEYEIDGRNYRVRHGMHNSNTSEDYRPAVRATVGTVMHRDSRRMHEFPPREVVALFPGMVGARWREDWAVEYDGPAPRIFERWDGTWYLVEEEAA